MGERLSLLPLFQAFDARAEVEGAAQAVTRRGPVTAMTRHVECGTIATQMNGIARVCNCRRALEALDNKGWNRSFHQRIFHEAMFVISMLICQSFFNIPLNRSTSRAAPAYSLSATVLGRSLARTLGSWK